MAGEHSNKVSVSEATARACFSFCKKYEYELSRGWLNYTNKHGTAPNLLWMKQTFTRLTYQDFDAKRLRSETNALEYILQIMPQVLERREEARLIEVEKEKKLQAKLLNGLQKSLEKHEFIFFRNYNNSYVKDDYGNVVKDGRFEEIVKLMKSAGFDPFTVRQFSKTLLDNVDVWFKRKFKEVYSNGKPPENGIDFEIWVAEQLKNLGWEAKTTKANGDNGIDVIAKKGALTAGIQCKRYNGSVGNKAVQEAIAGSQYMMLQFACVVTTGTFTKAAKELAEATGVLLLSANDLPKLEEKLRNMHREKSRF